MEATEKFLMILSEKTSVLTFPTSYYGNFSQLVSSLCTYMQTAAVGVGVITESAYILVYFVLLFFQILLMHFFRVYLSYCTISWEWLFDLAFWFGFLIGLFDLAIWFDYLIWLFDFAIDLTIWFFYMYLIWLFDSSQYISLSNITILVQYL